MGTIRCESTENQGVKFLIKFPLQVDMKKTPWTPSWLAIKEFSMKLISSEVHHNLVKQQSRVKEDGTLLEGFTDR